MSPVAASKGHRGACPQTRDAAMVERAERSLGCGPEGFRGSELDGSSSERFPGGDGGIPIGRTDRERVDLRLSEHQEIDSCEEAGLADRWGRGPAACGRRRGPRRIDPHHSRAWRCRTPKTRTKGYGIPLDGGDESTTRTPPRPRRRPRRQPSAPWQNPIIRSASAIAASASASE